MKDILDVSIDFKNYASIKEEEIEEFDNSFKVPDVCLLPSVQDCGDARKNKKKKSIKKDLFCIKDIKSEL